MASRRLRAAAFRASSSVDGGVCALRPSLLILKRRPIRGSVSLLSASHRHLFSTKSGFFAPDAHIVDEDPLSESGKRARWWNVAPAFATHACIGSPYAWSAVSSVLTREHGFVVSAASDWTFAETTLPLSIVFMLQGVGAAVAGKWQARVGPRVAMTAAGFCFGGGLMLGGAGIAMHSLPLLYAGYGLLGGTGIGLGYTPPVQTLLQWFPDKKGLASGMTIAGFGSGALLFAPAMNYLMNKYSKLPDYLGSSDAVEVVNKGGKYFTEVKSGAFQEVVIANAADIAKLSGKASELAEGVYAVGTGSTGACEALVTLGAVYLGTMLASAAIIRAPRIVDVPASGKKEEEEEEVKSVSVDEAMKSPNFYLLGTTFFCLASGGMGLFSVAKPMMTDVFSAAMPSIVTASFASSYLLMMSGSNLGGRLFWPSVSDNIGRRATMSTFAIGSIPLYLAVPTLVDMTITTQSAASLYGFLGSTCLAISAMGGVYALLPAYEADLFGVKNVGAIHGRMLLFSSAASLAGPSLLLNLRTKSENDAIRGLVETIDPETFQDAFGAPIDNIPQLMEAKSLTISKLLEVVPEGTPDPSPYLYDTTMYSMAALMGVGAVAHQFVRRPR